MKQVRKTGEKRTWERDVPGDTAVGMLTLQGGMVLIGWGTKITPVPQCSQEIIKIIISRKWETEVRSQDSQIQL